MLGVRELAHAYRTGGIELPDYVLMIAATVLLVATWNGNTQGLAVSAGLTIPILMFALLLISQKDFIKRSTSAVFIIFYLSVLGGFILLLANHPDGAMRIFALVALIACNDTFAYFVGVLIGKHKIAPSISPKKSWEGLIGGAIAAVIGGAFIFHSLFETTWLVGAAIGLMTVVTATCGDLIESAIKRDLAIKDMSNLLPGHGGIMDRLDSALFTAPAVWIAPPNNKNFSVKVVFPASGCDIIANVFRFSISCSYFIQSANIVFSYWFLLVTTLLLNKKI
jgi:phosphatidate cytidylyltransferase